jgi:membrane protease YdiL (CAAX protease family)
MTRKFRSRIVPFAVALFILSVVLSSLVAAAITQALYGGEIRDLQSYILEKPWPGLVVGMMVEAAVSYFGYKYLVKKREKREPLELGHKNSGREIFAGFAVSAVFISTVILTLHLFGAYTITGIHPGYGILVGLALGIGAGFAEEIFFRGVLLRKLSSNLSTPLAILIVSVAFGMSHLGNDDVSVLGVIAIIVEGGLLLSAAYFVTKRLWFAIGFHFGWNFLLGGIYGMNVSGVKITDALFTAESKGSEILTGGTTGPEGSIIMVLVSLLFSALLFYIAFKRGNLTRTKTT